MEVIFWVVVGAVGFFIALEVGRRAHADFMPLFRSKPQLCGMPNCDREADASEQGLYLKHGPHNRRYCSECIHVVNRREDEFYREQRIMEEVERLRELDEAKRRFNAERQQGYRG